MSNAVDVSGRRLGPISAIAEQRSAGLPNLDDDIELPPGALSIMSKPGIWMRIGLGAHPTPLASTRTESRDGQDQGIENQFAATAIV